MKLDSKATIRTKNFFKTLETRFNEIHNDKYDYSEFVYSTNKTKSTIICPIHGKFELDSSKHLDGRGCQKCGHSRTGQKLVHQQSKIINEFIKKHNNKYDYSLVIYNGANKKLIVICPIHGEFEIRAQHHKNGSGCKSCAKYGFNPSKPGIFYVLEIKPGIYKIGITNRTVQERYSPNDFKKVKVIFEKNFKSGKDLLNYENKVKNELQKYKYTGPKLLESAANTEIFTKKPLLS